MAKDWAARLGHVNFQCGECKRAFDGAPDLVEDDPATEWHPYRYFAHCPRCKAENQPQARWARALLKAHQTSTGPTTPEGKAATAANLDGHPTSEEAQRTRFNAMKHGMTARVASYFPAKPDKYPFCVRCEVDRGWCGQQSACVKQTEIFMLHHAAFDQRNPKVLSRLHADIHSALMASLQMCLQAVLGEGVLIKQPRVELDRDGNSQTLTYVDESGKRAYIYDYQSNPAFKPIADLVSRLGLSMNDLGMSVRGAEDEEESALGRLKMDPQTQEALSDFSQRMGKALEGAKDVIALAHASRNADPVLVEHQANVGGG